jgi:formylglycine-generating enzyme required for sulfatase activity
VKGALALLVFVAGGAFAQAGVVAVGAGAFTMGSDDGPADERPAHTVSLQLYFIDRTPVTNAYFADFLNRAGLVNARRQKRYDDDDSDARIHRKNGKWVADKGHEDHPAVEVSWAGARDYCASIGGRLPTEAEWEKAARGTEALRYPWGNEPPDPGRAQYGAAFNATSPVSAHPQGESPYGALDMAGNVWEWVSSAYRAYPYRADDGRESLDADVVRGTRGGGHDSPAAEITATQRGRNLSRNPKAGHHNIGFRCAYQ